MASVGLSSPPEPEGEKEVTMTSVVFLVWPHLGLPNRSVGRPQLSRLNFGILTSVRGRDIVLFVKGRIDRESAAGDIRSSAKRKFFYDDVMQEVFSIFFSFLLLSSL
jgi:hypothetical protein